MGMKCCRFSVHAHPIKSFPAKTSGVDCSWMGNGVEMCTVHIHFFCMTKVINLRITSFEELNILY
jgi:hypothetical protein